MANEVQIGIRNDVTPRKAGIKLDRVLAPSSHSGFQQSLSGQEDFPGLPSLALSLTHSWGGLRYYSPMQFTIPN